MDINAKASLLFYLEDEQLLSYIINTVKEAFSNQSSDLVVLNMDVSGALLMEQYEDLGRIILSDMDVIVAAFKEIAAATADSLSVSGEKFDCGRILVSVRLTDFPDIDEIKVLRLQDLWSRPIGSLVQCDGRLVAKSPDFSYTHAVCYICPQEFCHGSRGHSYTVINAPGFRETHLWKSKCICSYCGFPLTENISSRIDSRMTKFYIECSSNQEVKVSWCIPCLARGDLIDKLKTGFYYHITGCASLVEGTCNGYYIEVNNLIELNSAGTDALSIKNEETVKCIADVPDSCGFDVIIGLAFNFLRDITPPGTYLLFKMIMLLCLVSDIISSDDSTKPLSLLICSRNIDLIDRLLCSCGSFLSSFKRHLTDSSLCCVYGKDGLYYEGSLLTHDFGVTFIPRINTGNVQELTNCMETRNMPILQSKRHSTERVPFPGSVWGSVDMNEIKRNMNLHVEDVGIIPHFEKNLRNCISGFDLILVDGDEASCDRFEEVLSYHLLMKGLEKAENRDNALFKTSQEFINRCKSLQVEIPEDVENVLQDYFVTSRRDRSTHDTVFPRNALEIILALTRGHSRLVEKRFADIGDAILAIFVYEICLDCKFGIKNRLTSLGFHHVETLEEASEKFKVIVKWISEHVMTQLSRLQS